MSNSVPHGKRMMIDINTGIQKHLEFLKSRPDGSTKDPYINRISMLDDPCSRKLYYMRTAKNKAEPITNRLQGVLQ